MNTTDRVLEELQRIEAELHNLAESTDPEKAHCKAEDLLVKALKLVAQATEPVDVSVLVEAYEKVPKWYA